MPKCNCKTEIYSRVCGYFRPVSNWNHGKREEFNDRKTFKVKKTVLSVLSVLSLLTACSHNAISYGDGVMLETTINPNSYAFGVSFRYGKIITVAVRENVELEMQGVGSGSGGTSAGNTTAASSNSSLKVKVGPQITGYYVDAITAGAKPEDIKKYVTQESEKETVK